MRRPMGLAVVAAAMVLSSWLFAQEGHPLKGTWHGSWGLNATERTPVTLVMDWDGASITGIKVIAQIGHLPGLSSCTLACSGIGHV